MATDITYDPARPRHHPFALLLSSRCHTAVYASHLQIEKQIFPQGHHSAESGLLMLHTHTSYTLCHFTPSNEHDVAVDTMYHDGAVSIIAIVSQKF